MFDGVPLKAAVSRRKETGCLKPHLHFSHILKGIMPQNPTEVRNQNQNFSQKLAMAPSFLTQKVQTLEAYTAWSQRAFLPFRIFCRTLLLPGLYAPAELTLHNGLFPRSAPCFHIPRTLLLRALFPYSTLPAISQTLVGSPFSL